MESSYTDMDGPLFVHDSGGTGRPVVLLHGLGGSQADWWRVAATLRADHRVIGIDLPGFGRSRLAGRVSSVDANEQLVYRFLRERLDRPAVLVGTSMSGAIALGVAARMGHRLGGLVLVNPWLPDVEASGAKAVWAAKLKAVLLGRRGDADAETRTRQFFRLCCAEPTGYRPMSRRRYGRRCRRNWTPPSRTPASGRRRSHWCACSPSRPGTG